MGCRIAHDRDQGIAMFYCSTKDTAFGPVFYDGDDRVHDAHERAQAFLRWLDTTEIWGTYDKALRAGRPSDRDPRELTSPGIEQALTTGAGRKRRSGHARKTCPTKWSRNDRAGDDYICTAPVRGEGERAVLAVQARTVAAAVSTVRPRAAGARARSAGGRRGKMRAELQGWRTTDAYTRGRRRADAPTPVPLSHRAADRARRRRVRVVKMSSTATERDDIRALRGKRPMICHRSVNTVPTSDDCKGDHPPSGNDGGRSAVR